jgi:hypothetical protein
MIDGMLILQAKGLGHPPLGATAEVDHGVEVVVAKIIETERLLAVG